MVKTAKKYDARLTSGKPAKDLRDALPIWYHLGLRGMRSLANTISGKCMRENHGVVSVLDCAKLAARTRMPGQHRRGADCGCWECATDRTTHNCDNPARCAEMAKKLLEQLEPKWHPGEAGNLDSLTLMRSRKQTNDRAQGAGGRITFDPSITDGATTMEAFRVFAGSEDLAKTAVVRPPRPFAVQQEEVEIFTDGSCVKDGEGGLLAGSGLWYGPDDRRNKALRVPGTQSNQTAELYAIIAAIDLTPPFAPLHIVSD
ncbi:hypothetical protein LXA43DRAFT_870302, partial [Ganoderma leucocontextum]